MVVAGGRGAAALTPVALGGGLHPRESTGTGSGGCGQVPALSPRWGCGFLTWAAQPRLLAGSWDFLPSFPPQPRPHSSTSSFKQLLEGGKTDGKEAAPSIEFIIRLLPGPGAWVLVPSSGRWPPLHPEQVLAGTVRRGRAVSTDGLSPGSRSPLSLGREKPHPPRRLHAFLLAGHKVLGAALPTAFATTLRIPVDGGAAPRSLPASPIPHSASWSFGPFPSRAPEALCSHTFSDGLARPLRQGTAPATQGLGHTTAPPPSAQQLTRSPAAPLGASSGAPGCGRRR